MKTLDNEIIVHRNESFCIDKLVQNKDGSPYIVSNKLNNPYFLLSVSTTRYQQKDRYIINYWLPVNIPTFKYTNAVDLLSVKDENGQTKYPDFSSANGILNGFIDGIAVTFNDGDAVFYLDKDGEREYKYKLYDVWYDYVCRIVKAFLPEETKVWVEQSYVYSIQLVAGIDMKSYLQHECTLNDIHFEETFDTTQLYDLLTDAGIIVNVNPDRKLAVIDNVTTILAPTKLSVLSSLQGEL